MKKLESLLEFAAKKKASDLHIKVSKPAIFRRHGELVVHRGADKVTREDIQTFLESLTSSEQREQLRKRGSLDLSHTLHDGTRFRIHAYANRGELSLAVRVISAGALSIEDLKLPSAVASIAQPDSHGSGEGGAGGGAAAGAVDPDQEIAMQAFGCPESMHFCLHSSKVPMSLSVRKPLW